MTEIEIARIAHELNRTVQLLLGQSVSPGWEDAPQWMRDSILAGVRFHHQHPEAGPEGSHANWMRHRRDAGWTHGPVKDEQAKTHPNLCAYDLLPAEEKVKDHVFCAVVRALS